MPVPEILFNALNPEPIAEVLPGLLKEIEPFLKSIGFISLFHWMWENPLITLGALGAFIWMFSSKNT
ncbi:MAG: hypothetical protein WCD20_15080 [Rhodomicrobium sp.]